MTSFPVAGQVQQDLPHLRNHFLKMSLNQVLMKLDISYVSGAGFLKFYKHQAVYTKVKFI